MIGLDLDSFRHISVLYIFVYLWDSHCACKLYNAVFQDDLNQ